MYSYLDLETIHAVTERDRIIEDKHGLIRWIRRNEQYIANKNGR